MTLKRTTHWATRELHELLVSRAHAPFAWGTNDCALFAANAIQAMTGTDIAAAFRGKDGAAAYSDEASALALIQKVTGSTATIATAVGDAAAWCAQQHGLIEWTRDGKPSPLYAQRGDLVVVENGGRLIAGILHLTGRHVVSMAESGIVKLPPGSLRRAWKV